MCCIVQHSRSCSERTSFHRKNGSEITKLHSVHVSQGACSRLHQLRKQTPPLSSLTPYPHNCLVSLFLICTVGGGEKRINRGKHEEQAQKFSLPGGLTVAGAEQVRAVLRADMHSLRGDI